MSETSVSLPSPQPAPPSFRLRSSVTWMYFEKHQQNFTSLHPSAQMLSPFLAEIAFPFPHPLCCFLFLHSSYFYLKFDFVVVVNVMVLAFPTEIQASKGWEPCYSHSQLYACFLSGAWITVNIQCISWWMKFCSTPQIHSGHVLPPSPSAAQQAGLHFWVHTRLFLAPGLISLLPLLSEFFWLLPLTLLPIVYYATLASSSPGSPAWLHHFLTSPNSLDCSTGCHNTLWNDHWAYILLWNG